jgi:hypothetical protein
MLDGAPAAGMKPHQGEQCGRVLAHVAHTGGGVHGARAVEHGVDVDALQLGRQQAHRGQLGGATPDPVPHGKAHQPALALGQRVELAAVAGDCDRVFGKRQAVLLVHALRLEHRVTRLFGAARLADHRRECRRQQLADAREGAVEAVRVGVVEEKHLHAIVRAAERLAG